MKIACYTPNPVVHETLCATLAPLDIAYVKFSTRVPIEAKLSGSEFDLVILDKDFTKMSPGFLAKMRNKDDRRLSVIGISTANPTGQIKFALDAGVTDFINDYTNADEVAGRVSLVVKRLECETQDKVVFDKFVLDKRSQRIFYDGEIIRMPSLLFELAMLFFSAPDAVISARTIDLALWGEDSGAPYHRVALVIYRLRAKLGLAGTRSVVLSNRFGKGYVLHPV